ENIEISGLSFGKEKGKAQPGDQIVYVQESGDQKRKEVPDDAGAVVIAGASNAISKEALEALDRYLEGKGKLIVLADVLTDRGYKDMVNTGLEDFLKKYGVELTNQYVHSFGRVMRNARGQLIPDFDRAPTMVYATVDQEAQSGLAKKFAREFFTFTTARGVKAAGGGGKDRGRPH